MGLIFVAEQFSLDVTGTLVGVGNMDAQMRTAGEENWEQFGVRWELELKKERANAAAELLRVLPPERWVGAAVGILVAHTDFRDTSWQESRMDRCRADRLAWWQELTQGFQKGRLVIEKQDRTIEHVKRWMDRSVAPMLAVLREKTSQAYLDQMLVSGAARWKTRHRQLLGSSGKNLPKGKRE